MDEPAAEPPVIDGRAAFAAAVRWGFESAFAEEARRIVAVDPAFAEWPLDDTALLPRLASWLRRPQRRLVLLAAQYDDIQRRCPRFSAWRVDWMHAIDAWVAPEELAADLPTVLASDRSTIVHLIDAQRWRGRAERDERRARQWCEQLDAVLQRCERGFAAKPLGL